MFRDTEAQIPHSYLHWIMIETMTEYEIFFASVKRRKQNVGVIN